jgi:hypothetical protein
LSTLLHYATGIGLALGMVAVVAFALCVMVWSCFAVCSTFFALVGKRHRHRDWQNLNQSR